jgi:hypothetical protein
VSEYVNAVPVYRSSCLACTQIPLGVDFDLKLCAAMKTNITQILFQSWSSLRHGNGFERKQWTAAHLTRLLVTPDYNEASFTAHVPGLYIL